MHACKTTPQPAAASPPLERVAGFDFNLHPLRPLPRFGRRQTVGLSTAISFDPETIVRAATGHSLSHILEEMDYGSYRVMLAWVRSLESGAKMQRGTREALERLTTPPDDVNKMMTSDELLTLPNAMTGYWRMLFRTFRRGTGPTWRGLLVRLAWQDRELHALERLSEQEQVARRKALFHPSIAYWHATGIFGQHFRTALVLDKTLEHLAWADVQLSSSPHRVLRVDPVIGLVRPGKNPMRHWFDRLLQLTGASNLSDFCDLLAERADEQAERMFTHLELKQWATAHKPLPQALAHQMLKACQPEVDVHRERAQLWIARLLTFLTSFVQAFAVDPVEEATAQAVVFQRLIDLRTKLTG